MRTSYRSLWRANFRDLLIHFLMDTFCWSRFELLTSFTTSTRNVSNLTIKPRTHFLVTFLEFLETQDIPGPPPEPIEAHIESTSLFTFLITKLYSNLDQLPDKIKLLIEFQDGFLIATASPQLQSLLLSLVMALEFDSHVGRLAAEFEDVDLERQAAVFEDVEAFHDLLFKASNSRQHFKATQTKLATMEECTVVISEGDQNRCENWYSSDDDNNLTLRTPSPKSNSMKNIKKIRIKCPKCDYGTRWKQNLNRHLRKAHKLEPSQVLTPSNTSWYCGQSEELSDASNIENVDNETIPPVLPKSTSRSWRQLSLDSVRGKSRRTSLIESDTEQNLTIKGSTPQKVGRPATSEASNLKKYKCPFAGCSNRYATSRMLKYHKNVHNRMRPFECRASNCRDAFSNPMNRHSHEKRIHKNLSVEYSSVHERDAKLNPFTNSSWHECPKCNYGTSWKQNLNRHLQKDHKLERSQVLKPSNTNLDCARSNEPFKEHSSKTADVNKATIRSVLLQSKSRPWRQLGLDSATINSRRTSTDSDTERDLTIKGLVPRKVGRPPIRETSKLKKYKCSFAGCSKRYASSNMLSYHKNVHNRMRPFECRAINCRDAFSNPMNRYSHEKRVHKNSKLQNKVHDPRITHAMVKEHHICVFCENKFSTSAIRDFHQAKCLATLKI